MQKIAKKNSSTTSEKCDYNIIIFESHFGCSRTNQEKYAFAKTSEP